MRRKTWTAVLVTVVLMVVAGNLPGRLPPSWLVAGSALWDGLVVAGSALWDGLVARLPALARELQTPAVAVGAADSTSRLWARRISYLVGPDGKVVKAYPDVSPGKHAGEVLADIGQLQAGK